MDSTWKAIATRDRAEEEEEELGGGGGGVQRFEVVQATGSFIWKLRGVTLNPKP